MAQLADGIPLNSGFKFELREVDRETLEDALCAANTDPLVDGIMVYYPIFGTGQDQYLQQIVALEKDVEGLSHQYISNMYHNIRFLDAHNTKKSILPCTPLAVIKILEYLRIYNTILPYGNRLHGRTITVINRSEVVGRPLAALLANDGASVYSVDIGDVQQFTRGEGLRQRAHRVVEKPGMTLADVLPLSDVVISGVPGANYKVPCELLKDGAVCINFSSEKNFAADDVKRKASIYVPAIGKVTIVVLLRNLLVSGILQVWDGNGSLLMMNSVLCRTRSMRLQRRRRRRRRRMRPCRRPRAHRHAPGGNEPKLMIPSIETKFKTSYPISICKKKCPASTPSKHRGD